MSQTNGQCRGLSITSLKMGTCVTTFLDGGLLSKSVFFYFEGPLKTFFDPQAMVFEKDRADLAL